MSLQKGSIIFVVFFVLSSVNAMGDGHDVMEAQFPYHTRIETFRDNLKLGAHSGAVISTLFVITTKSAVVNGTHYIIKLGIVNPPANDTSIMFSTNIPPYFPPTDQDHIALLKMDQEIAFNLHVQPVTLPLSNDRVPNYVAQATGFTPDGRLRFLNVRVNSPEFCGPGWPEYQYWDGTLCTRSIGAYDELAYGNMCNEKGAPLVILANRTLVGIFDNSTVACSHEEEYHSYLFIKIEPYADWIRSVVNLTLIHNNNGVDGDDTYHSKVIRQVNLCLQNKRCCSA